MATPNVSGFNPKFPSKKFRDAIIFTMQMGAPNKSEEKVTFLWPASVANTTDRQWDLNAAPTKISKERKLQLDCAVEFVDRVGYGTPFGTFETPRIRITLLGDEYVQVADAPKALLGGNTYSYNFTEPPVALFDVDVYTVHYTADDEA